MPTEQQELVRKRIERRVINNRALLERMGITPDAYARATLNALIMNPQVAECTPVSLEKALISSISCGLVPDGRQAVIVPFKGVATFIPMIEGRLALARQALPGIAFRARCVYQGDLWEYSEGLRPVLDHTPKAADKRDDKIIAAYAIAELPGSGAREFEVLLRGDIDRYMALSPSGKRGPWGKHYGEMAEKTVLGLVLKRLPKGKGGIVVPETPRDMERWEVDATDDQGRPVVDVTDTSEWIDDPEDAATEAPAETVTETRQEPEAQAPQQAQAEAKAPPEQPPHPAETGEAEAEQGQFGQSPF